ncbi:hypothetical protein [Nocardia sp. NPDC005978]|uniref:hypothetical protein n=1 Tax=unclassified Nocardia TaxID=2637762 RepID=UPI0033B0FDFA
MTNPKPPTWAVLVVLAVAAAVALSALFVVVIAVTSDTLPLLVPGVAALVLAGWVGNRGLQLRARSTAD